MSWNVEYTNEFENWWQGLKTAEQEDVVASVALLEQKGPNLDYPYCSKIKGSKFEKMRELRVQHKGRPYRIFYVFDPRRVAILLIGGDKSGKDRFYEKWIPVVDKIYAAHLDELRKEDDTHG